MKNINGGYLYHIVRYKKLNLGQKLHFGGQPNYFCRYMNSRDFTTGGIDLNSMLINKEFDELNTEEEKCLKSYVYESCLMVRELVFENVRLREFPDLPSRLECLYCAETLGEARRWIPILLRMDKVEKPLQIVKLKASGKLFKGDGNLVIRNTNSIDCKIEMARKYWNQETTSENIELLFVGDVEVVDIIEDLMQ